MSLSIRYMLTMSIKKTSENCDGRNSKIEFDLRLEDSCAGSATALYKNIETMLSDFAAQQTILKDPPLTI